MNKFILFAALAALASAPADGQTNRYSATTGDVVLSGTATTLTVQKRAGSDVAMESITVYCSVACNFSQAYNGANATATAGTATPVPANTSTPATASAWTASNVGTGTSVGPIVHLGAGGTITVDVSKVVLNGSPAAANYSVIVAAISGTANITAIWSEKQ